MYYDKGRMQDSRSGDAVSGNLSTMSRGRTTADSRFGGGGGGFSAPSGGGFRSRSADSGFGRRPEAPAAQQKGGLGADRSGARMGGNGYADPAGAGQPKGGYWQDLLGLQKAARPGAAGTPGSVYGSPAAMPYLPGNAATPRMAQGVPQEAMQSNPDTRQIGPNAIPIGEAPATSPADLARMQYMRRAVEGRGAQNAVQQMQRRAMDERMLARGAPQYLLGY